MGRATATISRGCERRNFLLSLLFAKPHNKSPAKANQDNHCAKLIKNKVFALGDASKAGQEKATKKAKAKRVNVPSQSLDTQSVLLARFQFFDSSF
jgi:hypothetical protein